MLDQFTARNYNTRRWTNPYDAPGASDALARQDCAGNSVARVAATTTSADVSIRAAKCLVRSPSWKPIKIRHSTAKTTNMKDRSRRRLWPFPPKKMSIVRTSVIELCTKSRAGIPISEK